MHTKSTTPMCPSFFPPYCLLPLTCHKTSSIHDAGGLCPNVATAHISDANAGPIFKSLESLSIRRSATPIHLFPGSICSFARDHSMPATVLPGSSSSRWMMAEEEEEEDEEEEEERGRRSFPPVRS